MKKNDPAADSVAAFEAAAAEDTGPCLLRLYVIGATPRSMRAIVNIRKICEEHLHGRYELEVVDISQHPALAAGDQIIATPTLIKKLPLPLRRFIGDMSQTERILVGLDLRKLQDKKTPPA
jgi:circadian clock protein KaiB